MAIALIHQDSDILSSKKRGILLFEAATAGGRIIAEGKGHVKSGSSHLDS
jgi:hypothetical protein